MGVLYIDGKQKGSLADILRTVRDVGGRLNRCERWFGKSADQSGNNWGEEDGLTAFQCISGDGDFGSDTDDEAKILGSADTPICADAKSFVLAEGLVTDVSEDDPYVLRIAYGSGALQDAIDAGNFTTKMVKFDSVGPISASIPFSFECGSLPPGTKVWGQCKNANDDATADFYFAIQELLTEPTIIV